MDAKRRKEVEQQLKAAGYHVTETMRFQQGKCTMYRHKPQMTEEGELLRACGDVVPNQPVHPDHKARLTLRGLRDWPFRGVCILNPCVCRQHLSAEAFDAWMTEHGIHEPDQVGPMQPVQTVNPAEVRLDAETIPVVANASVAEAESAKAKAAEEAEEEKPLPPGHAPVGAKSKGVCSCGWSSHAGTGASRRTSLTGHLNQMARELVPA